MASPRRVKVLETWLHQDPVGLNEFSELLHDVIELMSLLLGEQAFGKGASHDLFSVSALFKHLVDCITETLIINQSVWKHILVNQI